ncbi:SPOR domain-containing protein [Histidinibacterium aquaticum]|uniref:SPOR domain-containing protein n=1 Tax=Histidinibacterium aquaticum TaxID=2613962 RepID=A0A5J5GM65_9RHOB|nr:SPOR domain-containing protein [Histidinibacterium aquaticum]KAA9008743.1 SPOR domain-containing protein [Histidinibacterium aquaticum]
MTGTTGFPKPRRARLHPIGLGLAAGLLLTACENGELQMPFASRATETPAADSAAAGTVELVERDVEAPEVFQVTEPGLWDGRPSLGGVWVAHPDVDEPERVIIRNRENGQFVIGALFRRERDNPGPRLQVSSDAAEALGVLAGAPTELNVTALRREEGPGDAAAVSAPAPSDETATFDEAPGVETASLEPAGTTPAAPAAEATLAPAPQAAPDQQPQGGSDLDRPYVQIGIFSVEANAEGTAERMRSVGVVPTVRQQETQGRAFWRVIVGPARTEAERAELLEKVKAEGFEDAYAVTD